MIAQHIEEMYDNMRITIFNTNIKLPMKEAADIFL